MSRLIPLMVTLLLFSVASAAPGCIWVKSDIKTKMIVNDRLIIDSYRCEIENYNASDEPETKKAIILKPGHHEIAIEISNIYTEIELLNIDKDLPLRGLKFSKQSASNVGNSIRVYDKNWRHIRTLNGPVNEYQSTGRQGSENVIVGFFKLKDGKYYIENLRSLGGDCNACMRYVVDTYKVVDAGLEVIDTRDYNISDYKRYAVKKIGIN